MWAIITDVILTGVLLIFGIIGFKRGFVVSVMKFISRFAAFIGALLLRDPVCLALQDWGMYAWLGDVIREVFHVPQAQESFTESLGVSGENLFGNLLDNIATVGGNLMFDNMVEAVVSFIINLLIFILLFLVLLLLLKLLTMLLDKIMSLPVLSVANRIFGFVIGALKAGIILYVVVGVIFIFVPVVKQIEVDQVIGGSYFFDWFIQNNSISELFHGEAF